MQNQSHINIHQLALESGQPVTEVWSFINCNPFHTMSGQHFIAIQTALEQQNGIQYLPQHPRKGTPYIGIMVPNNTDAESGTYISQVIATLKHLFSIHRVPFVLYVQNQAQFEGMDAFVKYLCSAVLICTQRTTEIVAACEQYNTPFVAIETDSLPSSPLGRVIAGNNREGQRIAVEKLIALGHRHIAYITGKINSANAQERLHGYYDALKNAAIPVSQALIHEGDWHRRKAQCLTDDILNLDPRPTAIACANDLSALGVYASLETHQLRVGKDMDVVGFDDIDISNQISPALSTMHQPAEHIGLLAWQTLTQLLEDKAPAQNSIAITTQWVGRESTHLLTN